MSKIHIEQRGDERGIYTVVYTTGLTRGVSFRTVAPVKQVRAAKHALKSGTTREKALALKAQFDGK